MLGVAVLIALVLGSVIGPMIYGKDPNHVDLAASYSPPTRQHPFGTDNIGRDTLARVLISGRISLIVGIVSMVITISLGTLVGGLAGFFSKLDALLMRLTDLFLCLPVLPLLLVLTMLFRDTLRATFGPEIGMFLLIVSVIGGLNWMGTARVVRGQVLSIREQEFVIAAVSIGAGSFRVLARHIYPNVLSPIIVAATLSVAQAILLESVLSFLGLGFPPDFPTWGRLLSDSKDFLAVAPFTVFWPGLFISLTILSINFVGDGLRDALDPRLRI